jgi:RHS repeat-associated protein
VTTNASGQVVRRHEFLPFGEEWQPAVPPGDPRLFTGQEHDPETGLDYFGARYYRANIGRFTTVDPALDQGAALMDPQRWNRHAYVRNNPLRYTDPDGRDWIEYHGQNLTWFGGKAGDYSQPIAQYPASSGLPGYQFRDYQNLKDAGPIPAGTYEINLQPDPDRVAQADPRTGELEANPSGGIEHVPVSTALQNGTTVTYGAGGTGGGWGNVRAELTPKPDTNTHGRFGFFLHDSDKGFSHGCIDTKPAVLAKLIAYRAAHPNEQKFEVRVRYTSDTTARRPQ